LAKGRVSRLATFPALHFRSVQLVIMASPSASMVRPSCAAATACGCRARSSGASMVIATSGRRVIALMRPTSVTHTRPRDHQVKSPRSRSLGLFLASTIRQGCSIMQCRCDCGVWVSSQACRRNDSHAVLNMFHYNKSNHLSRAILKRQKRSYKLIVFNNRTISIVEGIWYRM